MQTLEKILHEFGANPNGPMPIRLPEFSRENLAELFARLGFKVGAEIGVNKGYYSSILCRYNPGLERLYSIDHWKKSEVYEEAKKLLYGYPCILMRKNSLDASISFRIGSLDFVYIDADHRYPAIKSDLEAWEPKVRAGGILAGHDYKEIPGKPYRVLTAVNEYTKKNRITPWFVIGEKFASWPSWFWVKK